MFHFVWKTNRIGVKLYSPIYLYNKSTDRILDGKCIIDSGADNLHIITDMKFISQLDFVDFNELGFRPPKESIVDIGRLKNCLMKSRTQGSAGSQVSYRGFLRTVQVGGIVIKNIKFSFCLTNESSNIKNVFLFPLGLLYLNEVTIKPDGIIRTILPGNFAEYNYLENSLKFKDFSKYSLTKDKFIGDCKIISHCYQNNYVDPTDEVESMTCEEFCIKYHCNKPIDVKKTDIKQLYKDYIVLRTEFLDGLSTIVAKCKKEDFHYILPDKRMIHLDNYGDCVLVEY